MPSVKRQTFKKPVAKPHGRGGVIDRIRPVGEGADERITLSVYGRSGTGKTTFACSFPKPLLLIGTEEGRRSVKDVPGVDFVLIRDSDELRELTEYVNEGRFKTVVLDTASSLQDLITKELLGLDETPTQRSWGMATRDQWSQIGVQTKERLRGLLDLSCHVVIVSQERTFEPEDSNEIITPHVTSALMPSVAGWLGPAAQYVCQCFLRQRLVEKQMRIGKKVVTKQVVMPGTEFCLRVKPHPVYAAKFRVPLEKALKMPEVIIDPTYEKIAKYM